jgi:hypothetical protein
MWLAPQEQPELLVLQVQVLQVQVPREHRTQQ